MHCLRHTDQDLANAAKKYATRRAFYLCSPSMYNTAVRRGILNDICQHMPPAHQKHTFESVEAVAKQYDTPSQFKLRAENHYQAAKRNGWLPMLFPQSRLKALQDKINKAA